MPVHCGKTAAGLRALNGMALGNYKLQACSKRLYSHSLTNFLHWGWKSLNYLQGGTTRDSPDESCSEQLGKYLGEPNWQKVQGANCFKLVFGGPFFISTSRTKTNHDMRRLWHVGLFLGWSIIRYHLSLQIWSCPWCSRLWFKRYLYFWRPLGEMIQFD